MNKPPRSDKDIPTTRLQLDRSTGRLVKSPAVESFLKGPIPLGWLSIVAALPGKTLHTSVALWWLHGLCKGAPFKFTEKARKTFNVDRGAANAALIRLEAAGLVSVIRHPGRCPIVSIRLVAEP